MKAKKISVRLFRFIKKNKPVVLSALGVIIVFAIFQNCGREYASMVQQRTLDSHEAGIIVGGGGTAMVTPTPFPTPACAGTRAIPTMRSLIAMGEGHVCAIVPGGTVKCWGQGYKGQLGNGGSGGAWTPVFVLDTTGSGKLKNIVSLSTGDETTCALSDVGNVYCWGLVGSNYYYIPKLLTTNVRQLSAGTFGFNICALTNTGSVTCWNDFASSYTITGFSSNVTSISIGEFHGCAVLDTGNLQCWSSHFYAGNSVGQLGTGTTGTPPINTPYTVVNTAGGRPLSGVVSVIADDYHTCALLSNTNVACWGQGSEGQLGNGATNQSSKPVIVVSQSGSPITACTLVGIRTDRHNCILQGTNGDMLCWGNNANGELGIGSSGNYSAVPVQVNGLTSGVIAGATSGYYNSCAIISSGRVMCWGNNSSGQLGVGNWNNSLVPQQVQNYP